MLQDYLAKEEQDQMIKEFKDANAEAQCAFHACKKDGSQILQLRYKLQLTP